LIFKKRGFAILIAVVVVCLSTVFSVHRFLGSACQKVADSFYSGVSNPAWGKNATLPSVNDQLVGETRSRYTAANGLYAMLSGNAALSNTDTAAQLRAAKENLRSAATISDKFQANETLGKAFSAATNALRAQTLSDRDLQMLTSYENDFKNAQNIIDTQSGYNDAVRTFYRNTLDVFPTNLLTWIVANKVPVLFA